MLIGHITAELETYAPIPLQEDYDNSGLIIGSPAQECTGVLLAVDVTPSIVQEAIDYGCNLIVAHHPLIFKGLKRLTGQTSVEQSTIMAIRAGIAIYACHTCLDSATGGVSHKLAQMLELNDIRVLEPQSHKLMKLSTFVPDDYVEMVRMSLFDAGAGEIGNYDCCSYILNGEGTFRAKDGANPFVGEIGSIHTENETRVEVLLPTWRRHAVEEALRQSHPYEEPAYDFIATENLSYLTGLGAVGNLSATITARQLVDKVKQTFNSPIARCTSYDMDAPIRRVALCGGSGSSLINKAITSGAQAFITSDTKYHDFVEYAKSILIIDIGHFESENCTKEIFYHIITKKFPNFAVRCSNAEINPINYL